MKVVIKPIVWFKPYQNNARTHPDSQIDMLAGLLKKHGPDQPIVTDEKGVILKGHGRRLAAIAAGIKEFPAVIRSGLSESEKSAIRIQDNQVALLSGWSAELIQSEIANLKLTGFDIPLLGFPESQLRGWGISAGTDSAQDPEIVPDLPKNPVVRRGDRWLLGDHVLYCGDSTSKSDVAACSGKFKGQMVFTDPPYGVAYRDTGAGAWNADKLAKKRAGTLNPRFDAIENDDLDDDQLFAFLVAYLTVQPLASNASQYVCHASLKAHIFRQALLKIGYVIRAECIWAKTRPGFNFAHYKHKHEPIYYSVHAKKSPVWYGDQSQTTLWAVASESGSVYEHPTQKPVGIPIIAINNSSKAGDFVYEPFSGSGTTLIACEMTGRRCIAIELSPAYVQVGIERWQKFTGRLAALDGKTLEQVAKARRTGTPKGKTDGAVAKQVRGVPAGVPGRPAGG